MYTALLILHLFVSVLLVAAVLIQSGKGSSLANIFGGGGMETVFGAETPTILNKITATLAIIFIVTCVLLATIPGRLTQKSLLQGELQKKAPAAPSAPAGTAAPTAAPVAPAAPAVPASPAPAAPAK